MVNPETCLMFTTGLSALDEYELLQLSNDEVLSQVATVQGVSDGYTVKRFLRSGEADQFIGWAEEYHAPNETAVSERIRQWGAGWVAPTSHAYDTVGLARIAAQAGLVYPSPAIEHTLEYKPAFYHCMREAGVPVPDTSEPCRTAAQIIHAVKGFDGIGFIKTDGGTGGDGACLIDLHEFNKEYTDELLAWHFARRNDGGCGTSIVQEYYGDQEFGFEAMVEATPDGPRIVWSMTTRKVTLDYFGRWLEHVLDPDDKGRLWYTENQIIPGATRAIAAIDRYDRRMGGAGLPNCVINMDWRAEAGTAKLLDASTRWFPRAQNMANATVGFACGNDFFPGLARRWARGDQIPAEAFEPRRAPRAVINRKAFTEGGLLVQYQPQIGDHIAYTEKLGPGNHLPYIGDPEQGSSLLPLKHPILCADGRDVSEAESNWHRRVADLGLAAMNDRWLTGYSGDGGRWRTPARIRVIPTH